MNTTCRICLKSVREGAHYHPTCLRALFGSAKAPRFELTATKFYTAALAMVGRSSLSGIQKKISVNLSADRETLQVAAEGGRYILKPQTETFPALPENEHVTTCLAQLVEIEVAPFGMVSLADESLAYVSKRFDRLPDGRKRRQEDFCQLAEKPAKDKYDASAELCVRLVRKHATEPLIEILKLFRMFLFAWWSGNGDLHLKNLSMLVDEQGIIRLTPAYDLVCTRLVIPDDQLALPVVGRKDKLTRNNWLEFAEYCEVPEKAAVRMIDQQAAALTNALTLIDASFLPVDQKEDFKKLIADRTSSLS